jgi:proteic killer suppression protein
VQVEFSSSSLAKAFASKSEAIKQFGEARGKKFAMAVKWIRQAKSMADLYKIPSLKFHPLHGDRDGEFAIALTGNWRLVVTFPADEICRIREVEDYHGR